MGILGASNNAPGVGASLVFIGNHAYGYSGAFASAGAASADTTYLDFTMPSNSYAKGWLNLAVKGGGAGERFMTVAINGQLIIDIKQDGNPDFLNNFPIPVLFPADARCEVKAGTNGGEVFGITFVGEVFE